MLYNRQVIYKFINYILYKKKINIYIFFNYNKFIYILFIFLEFYKDIELYSLLFG